MHASILYSNDHKLQDPHLDFPWDSVTRQGINSNRRCCQKLYPDSVPFMLFMPATEVGMYLFVWRSRKDYSLTQDKQEAVLVFIPFGKMLLLKGDTVHSGVYGCVDGRPHKMTRFYCYVIQDKGAAHDNRVTNNYFTDDTKKHRLSEFCKHGEAENKLFPAQSARHQNGTTTIVNRDNAKEDEFCSIGDEDCIKALEVVEALEEKRRKNKQREDEKSDSGMMGTTTGRVVYAV